MLFPCSESPNVFGYGDRSVGVVSGHQVLENFPRAEIVYFLDLVRSVGVEFDMINLDHSYVERGGARLFVSLLFSVLGVTLASDPLYICGL